MTLTVADYGSTKSHPVTRRELKLVARANLFVPRLLRLGEDVQLDRVQSAVVAFEVVHMIHRCSWKQ